jgi:glycosyltransferase involved in cell wall biosynthesis
MDILVHPSRREGLARALPQGSLAGIPVVAYDVDGNREGVIHDQTGYVVPAFDTERLREAMERLIADPELRRTLGTAGRAFAIARFDTTVMVQALERVYNDALASRSGVK